MVAGCTSEMPGTGLPYRIRCEKQSGHEGSHGCARLDGYYHWTDGSLSLESVARLYGIPPELLQYMAYPGQRSFPERRGRREPGLRDVVAEQLAEINDALPDDWQGKVEIEPVPPELTDTYDVAHGSAVRHCDHSRSSHSTLYAARERQCDDCGRYFTRRYPWDD